MNPRALMEARTEIRFTFYPTDVLGPFWAETLARSIHAEPHLLPRHPAELRGAAESRRLLVAYDRENDLLVGCAAAWPLPASDEGTWLKLGTVFLIEPYRYRNSGLAIADELYKRVLRAFQDRNILATATNRAAVRAGLRAGLVRISFADLPCHVRRAACSCPASRTGTQDSLLCPLADAACVLCVTPETYERLGRPASPPLPL